MGRSAAETEVIVLAPAWPSERIEWAHFPIMDSRKWVHSLYSLILSIPHLILNEETTGQANNKR